MRSWQVGTVQDFARAIREARLEAGLTQRELAFAAGTGERFIVDLESGKPTSRLGLVLQVAASIGLRVNLSSES